jgi:RNA recognition motif-containing protein
LAVRLFIGNLPYSTSEADLRELFGAVAAPQHVVLPIDRETGRPRGFAFVDFADRSVADEVIRRFNAQPFNGRQMAVSEARAREDRPPGGFAPRPPGGGYAPRPPGGFTPRSGPLDSSSPPVPRTRSFGPDAPPRRQRGGPARRGRGGPERGGPKGPIKERVGGRVYDVDDSYEEDLGPNVDVEAELSAADADKGELADTAEPADKGELPDEEENSGNR